jgi:hypothetical protein
MRKKRKSPVRHRVKTHTRQGKRINSFMRGHGKKTSPYSKKKLLKHEGSTRKTMEDYKITFFYSKGRKETLPVAARDADDALNVALKNRKYKNLKPLRIDIKDGLGAMLGSVAGAAAGGIHSAIVSFRAQYAKGAKERAKLKQLQEERDAEKKAWLEDKSEEMLTKAKAGNRPAQIWCEQHNIGWESV